MKKTLFGILLAFVGLFIACKSYYSLELPERKKHLYHQILNPPGTIKLSEGLLYDYSEVNNLNWREYLFWTGRVFGTKSDEYLSILPDTLLWIQTDSCLHDYAKYYLRHYAYSNYPVVGITKQQAERYSKWRSDRVFENILITHGIIEINPHQNKDTNFTIEGYMSGSYLNYSPDPNYRYYPNYRLPTYEEWKRATVYADSIESRIQSKKHGKKFQECITRYPNIYCGIVPCKKDLLVWPSIQTYHYCYPKEIYYIYNLRGNVREWSCENFVTLGGGWSNTLSEIKNRDTVSVYNSDVQTGFRNVCEWKLYRPEDF